ncbi:polysaccharide deacetylase family protein [Afifella pfennigii]|uniref:polysaccharide deacetylase family protein n=1 Tax=Afifella pfennigii TaxID=209897 RepID=UPI000691F6C2|nr:polysaccharide deacetylase family protein [Afifella pfennigii]
MSLRHTGIRLTLEALAAVGAPRLLRHGSESAGMVLTLHHVRAEPAGAFAPNAGLAVAPSFLDALLTRLKERGRRFVPLARIVDNLSAGRSASNDVAITLDDGYRNNFTEALPVFRRHGAPFTIFVCSGFCDRKAALWWEALERIIAGREAIAGAGGPALATRSVSEKQHAFAAWRRYLTEDVEEQRQPEIVAALAKAADFDLEGLTRELVMDWDELRLLAREPLAGIGAHTDGHQALARLSAEEAGAAMARGAQRIEAELGRRPDLIAFPYGYAAAAGPREAELAGQAGFRAAFTTRPGTIDLGDNPHFLPRLSVNGLYQELSLQEVLTSPGLWRLGRGARRVLGGFSAGRAVTSTR